MLRISVLIIFSIFSTSNQVKIWDEEEESDMTTTDSLDVSNMAQLPLIDPTVNKSFEYDSVDCGEVFDFVQGEAVGFEFGYFSGVWNSYGDAKKCRIRFLVPARNSIKMFCEDFNIPADDGFCVFNPRGLFEGLSNGGSKECYFGNKRKVMIHFPYTDEMTTITITFIPQSWEMYDGQGAR